MFALSAGLVTFLIHLVGAAVFCGATAAFAQRLPLLSRSREVQQALWRFLWDTARMALWALIAYGTLLTATKQLPSPLAEWPQTVLVWIHTWL